MGKSKLLLALCCALPIAAEDPTEIVRRALRFHTQNDEVARNYTYLRRVETSALDKSGKVRHLDSETWDVTLLEGSPYSRLIMRDDKPLPPKEEQKQQAELQKSIEQRRKETPEQRQQRVAAWNRRRQAEQEQRKEVPEAFDFRLVGEETVDGAPAWIIEGTPRQDFKPRSKSAGYYKKLKGRIWVTKSDYFPVKIEAETIDTVSLGVFLARLRKGAQISVEHTRVNGEVWLPKHVWFTGDARFLLVKDAHIKRDLVYSNYRKFTAESRIVSTSQ